MRIFINDVNILIDLIKLELTSSFFELDAILCTTDFVLEELEESQKVVFESQSLKILNSTEETIIEISSLMQGNPGLSFEDCSVWVQAKRHKGILVTGDGKLRKVASRDGLEVRGLIFLIELIKEQGIRNTSDCIELLQRLKKINSRLPIPEIDNRIENWKKDLG